jgi:hypothetical protein
MGAKRYFGGKPICAAGRCGNRDPSDCGTDVADTRGSCNGWGHPTGSPAISCHS